MPNLFASLREEIVDAIKGVAGGVGDMLPKFLIAAVLVALGGLFGSAVGRVVQQLVESLKADEWLAKAGVDKFLERAGYKLNSAAFLGWLTKMFFVIIFLIAAFDFIGLSSVNSYLTEVLNYIPNVLVAAIMLFVASIAADLLGNIVAGGTKAVGSHLAALLSSVTRWAIWIFAFLLALSHLGIAPQYMYTLFAGFVAMLALAGGLAFGLGGKDAAAELIKEIRHELRGVRES